MYVEGCVCTIYNNKKSLSSIHHLLLTASYVGVNLLVHLGGVVCLQLCYDSVSITTFYIFVFTTEERISSSSSSSSSSNSINYLIGGLMSAGELTLG